MTVSKEADHGTLVSPVNIPCCRQEEHRHVCLSTAAKRGLLVVSLCLLIGGNYVYVHYIEDARNVLHSMSNELERVITGNYSYKAYQTQRDELRRCMLRKEEQVLMWYRWQERLIFENLMDIARETPNERTRVLEMNRRRSQWEHQWCNSTQLWSIEAEDRLMCIRNETDWVDGMAILGSSVVNKTGSMHNMEGEGEDWEAFPRRTSYPCPVLEFLASQSTIGREAVPLDWATSVLWHYLGLDEDRAAIPAFLVTGTAVESQGMAASSLDNTHRLANTVHMKKILKAVSEQRHCLDTLQYSAPFGLQKKNRFEALEDLHKLTEFGSNSTWPTVEAMKWCEQAGYNVSQVAFEINAFGREEVIPSILTLFSETFRQLKRLRGLQEVQNEPVDAKTAQEALNSELARRIADKMRKSKKK